LRHGGNNGGVGAAKPLRFVRFYTVPKVASRKLASPGGTVAETWTEAAGDPSCGAPIGAKAKRKVLRRTGAFLVEQGVSKPPSWEWFRVREDPIRR